MWNARKAAESSVLTGWCRTRKSDTSHRNRAVMKTRSPRRTLQAIRCCRALRRPDPSCASHRAMRPLRLARASSSGRLKTPTVTRPANTTVHRLMQSCFPTAVKPYLPGVHGRWLLRAAATVRTAEAAQKLRPAVPCGQFVADGFVVLCQVPHMSHQSAKPSLSYRPTVPDWPAPPPPRAWPGAR
jgi:hypothetical protein